MMIQPKKEEAMSKLSLRTLFTLLLLMVLAGCAVPAASPAVPATETQAAETRLITHAMGETAAPVNPQRVVVLDTGELDNALALGVTPVGAPLSDARQYQEYLADQLDGVSDIGTISEPNLELILALKPDLILGSKQRYEAIYEQLSAIAPTVLTESLRVPWQANFRLHAAALGKTSEAEQLLAGYADQVSALQAGLGDLLDTVTISVIRFRPGQVRLYLKNSYIGYILQDIGLQRPPAQDKDEFSSEITLEFIADTDADYIFITGYATDDSDMATFLESPMWTTLQGVQTEHALAVDDDTWISGLGIQSAKLVIDDMWRYLLNQEPPAPSATTSETTVADVTISHEGGETTFTSIPQRVVALEYSYIDALQSLGLQPIAYADDGVPAYLVQGLTDAGAVAVGTRNEPNLEAISQLQPDLIIADLTRHSAIYDQLSQIAPTLMFDSYRGSYENQIAIFEQLSQVLHQESAGQQVIADALAALEEARALAEGHGRSVVIGVLHSGGFTAHSAASFKGSLLAELGLPTALGPQAEEIQFLLDLEGIVTLAPEAFVITCAPEDNQILTDWGNQPVWQQLDAVKNQRVYVFNRDLWSKSRGLLALHLVLRDAAASGLLTDEPSRSTTCPDPVLE